MQAAASSEAPSDAGGPAAEAAGEPARPRSASFDLQRSGSEASAASSGRPLAEALAPLVADEGGGPFAAAAVQRLKHARSSSIDGGSGGAEGGERGGRRRLLGFMGRLFGLLGGKEATETLVRTASFRWGQRRRSVVAWDAVHGVFLSPPPPSRPLPCTLSCTAAPVR